MCQEPSTHQAETAGIWNVGLRLAISEIIADKDRKNKRFYFIKVEIEVLKTSVVKQLNQDSGTKRPVYPT